jgi:hypothetical protein
LKCNCFAAQACCGFLEIFHRSKGLEDAAKIMQQRILFAAVNQLPEASYEIDKSV